MAEASTTYVNRSAASAGRRTIGARPALYVTMRIGAGLLFMQYGATKLFGWFGGFGDTPGGTVELFSRLGVAGVLEFFGGALVVLGLFTRPVAVTLSLLMVAAYVTVHLPRGFIPIENNGDLSLLFAMIFAYVAACGSGRLSLDRLRNRLDS